MNTGQLMQDSYFSSCTISGPGSSGTKSWGADPWEWNDRLFPYLQSPHSSVEVEERVLFLHTGHCGRRRGSLAQPGSQVDYLWLPAATCGLLWPPVAPCSFKGLFGMPRGFCLHAFAQSIDSLYPEKFCPHFHLLLPYPSSNLVLKPLSSRHRPWPA